MTGWLKAGNVALLKFSYCLGSCVSVNHRLMSAASLVIGGVVLATACGSGDDASGKNDKIAGAGKSTSSPGASVEGRPDTSLPDDLQMRFEWDAPGDARTARAVASAEDYLRSIWHGVTKQNPNDPSYQKLSTHQAKTYAHDLIKKHVDGGWTLTGDNQYYRLKTDFVNLRTDLNSAPKKAVQANFCRNQQKFYGKSVKTGKKAVTKPSLKDYQEFTVLMVPTDKSGKHWKAQRIEVLGKSKGCREK